MPPNLPLWLNDDEEGFLKSLSVSRGQGTKLYKLTPEQWKTLEIKAGGWNVSRPGAIPATGVPGSTYRAPAKPAAHSEGITRVLQIDPAKAERALSSHGQLQERLRQELENRNLTPLSPCAIEPEYDLAWIVGDTIVVVEIKSVTDLNEVAQLRQGLGQVLHYRAALRKLYSGYAVEAAMLVERAPSEAFWRDVCQQAGVILVWPAELDRLFLELTAGA